MGNKVSSSAAVAPAAAAPVPVIGGGLMSTKLSAPMDPVTQCRVKSVELNQLQNDVTKKQQEIDTCNPEEANRRRTNEKLKMYEVYISEKKTQMNDLADGISNTISTIKSVHESSRPTRTYIKKLTNEAETLDRKKVEFEQQERTQRRAFLDNDPQSGVSGLLGVRTDDDKVLLAFWITYGLAVVLLTIVGLMVYGTQFSTVQKVQIGGITLLMAYIVAYYGIVYFG